MLVPKVRILITDKSGVSRSFDYCVEGEIERNFEKITQTAKFTIPNTYGVSNKETGMSSQNNIRGKNERITNLVKKGDKVSIFLRFLYVDNDKQTINPEVERFTGYISKVRPGYFASFECEDEMWTLKQNVFQGFQVPSSDTISAPVTLQKYIDFLKKKSGLSFDTDISDTSDLGTIQVSSGNTFADILDHIKTTYLFLCYFRNGKLTIRRGDQFVSNQTKTFIFNGKDANITDKGNLEWQFIDDVRLMVKFTCQVMQAGKSDKKTTRYIFINVKGDIVVKNEPEQGYNQIEHTTSNDFTEAQIKEQGISILKSVTYTGYKGEFSTFGEPVMDFGDSVNIVNQRYPELTSNGLLLRAVKTIFGNKGYFQHLNIYGQ